jgi:asparagine synthase (glutamine-hydrolysing)
VGSPRFRASSSARDRAGEKPLFYTIRGDEVAFASELAGLATDHDLSLEIDSEAIAGYLRRGCFVAPSTPFHRVARVRPGEVVTIRSGRASSRRFWRLNFEPAAATALSEDAFDAVFRGAVARQSDVAVPCGVFLSGGIDSSLVAAVARSLHPERPLSAFTVRFAETSYDEGVAAESAVAALGIPWATVTVSSSDVRGEIEKLVSVSGEPLADPAWMPASILSRRAVEDVRLVMVGEGADELFGRLPDVRRGLARRPVFTLASSAQVGDCRGRVGASGQRQEGDDLVPAQSVSSKGTSSPAWRDTWYGRRRFRRGCFGRLALAASRWHP